MAEYSVEVCRRLEERFRACALYRPMRVRRYDAGTELAYDVEGVGEKKAGRVSLVVEKFVGGGFAGQVYRVKVSGIEGGPIEGLEVGGIYAMKILIPPTVFAQVFRNALYWAGFQGPFQLQVNPAAARAGALWQKFIRRGAEIRFGRSDAVADIYATFVDGDLGSCGELGEWVEGRTWQLEVDDRLDLLKDWRRGETVDVEQLGSPEYRAKREFMADFVKLLSDMGAYEFARQYEWWTCKSQPNCLKRMDSKASPSEGLAAVDCRAGLTLLPFLPMSPGDFVLIGKGLARGSLVQFDRGDISKLGRFVEANVDKFSDMRQMLEDLKAAEQVYRYSLPDLTHNHVRLLYSQKLWSTMLGSAVTGWKVRNLVDGHCERKLRHSKALTLVFAVFGLIPFLGRVLRRIWGRSDWRQHYSALFASWVYLERAVRGRIAEKVIIWHRAGRVDEDRAVSVAGSVGRFLLHLPLSILPAGLHRLLTDVRYARERLAYYIVRPVRLYFNAELREQWLREMVTEGQSKHILTDEDAAVILSRVKDPFIQKYLKSLAVHICTLPVTQIVSVLVAIIYVLMHPEMPRAQAWGIGIGIIALFQVVPVSPGSLVRGLYVLYLVIRERNFRDYNIAVFLGFFKYIGYLAFPIQMAYHYPALARFMAAHWATEAVHIVPVFGERGALLEHWVFSLFYNWPLTIRRRMRRRAELRRSMAARYWHVVLCAVGAAVVLGIADFAYLRRTGEPPGFAGIWWVVLCVPLVCGAAVTLGCGGAALWKRVISAIVCGCLVGVLHTVFSAISSEEGGVAPGFILADFVWRVFVFAILSTVGAVITELKLPEPQFG
ncbi:MAG: hypothetical protein JSW23_11295 [Planctomycetota bacterium]|nr:MAG: hypothetical protein JSW23_11295 [Planctomycetota bacterium]